MRAFALLSALAVGQASLLYGLWVAWWPLTFIVAGVELTAAALLNEAGESRAAVGQDAWSDR